jgi:Alpha galactosidase C-terminal beta sandwich domain/Alpha galactosidase A
MLRGTTDTIAAMESTKHRRPGRPPLWTAVLVLAGTLFVALVSPCLAGAELNPPPGTDLKPVLGFSTWSSMRLNASAAADEREAQALHDSGLEGLGYDYFNQDDGWYVCPGPQGPSVDAYGRWVTNTQLFPAGPDGEDGITVLANYMHALGLKFGIYVTPGISMQAVASNTPIMGTSDTADEITTGKRENNYNCGGMVGIDYARPGAQPFVSSIADELASWGVDFVKLDGITDANAPDIAAWSRAIRQSGRPMQLDVTEGRFNPKIASTLDEDATQWESSPDIECYECEHEEIGFPLTDYANVKRRFATLAKWHAFSGSAFAAYADFDSVEVGNCEGDGLSVPARETVLSLWALASSPLIIGANLTELCPSDLQLLENTAVLALDQDGIVGAPVARGHEQQVIAKTLGDGAVAVGLFDTAGHPRTIATDARRLGLASCSAGYTITNLWSGQVSTDTSTTIAPRVPAEGVALLEVTPLCGS